MGKSDPLDDIIRSMIKHVTRLFLRSSCCDLLVDLERWSRCSQTNHVNKLLFRRRTLNIYYALNSRCLLDLDIYFIHSGRWLWRLIPVELVVLEYAVDFTVFVICASGVYLVLFNHD